MKVYSARTFLDKKTQKINIYELSEKDTDFLSKSLEKIELPENTGKLARDIWYNLIQNCIMMSSWSLPQKTFLASAGGKPFGITTFIDTGRSVHIDNIATWPVDGENVKLGGKAIVGAVFNEALQAKRGISLDTTTTWTPKLNKFYTDLGFERFEDEKTYRISGFNIINKLEEFNKILRISREIKPSEIDLSKELKTSNVRFG